MPTLSLVDGLSLGLAFWAHAHVFFLGIIKNHTINANKIHTYQSTMSSFVDLMNRDNLDTNIIAHDMNLIIMISS